jgi:alanyl-tRNA synthetase
MNSLELRQLYFDFFKAKGHVIVPSAPMVVKNDPTLMFTNAGMNQFKDIFLGNSQAINKRVANSQKCLRVSGKHNDLEEVGHDTYHHTMFEMLGNWSFGDYFKKEAIEWAWELLAKKLGIPEDRLYATIFEGSREDKVQRDDEAFMYWEKCFAKPEGRILEGSKKDNFWEMGETGPCGPCSEIHVDIRDDEERKKIPGRDLVNKGHPQVIEIWNLVFIQYNRRSDGVLEQLPSRHVDTGMGFERLCMVVQGKKSNYDTDIFQNIIREISVITGKEYGKNEKWDIALRVVADHLRAVSFSIADGQLPSNNKAGYVIRRILRRAVRYGYNSLGIEEPFMYRLVPVLADTMGAQYPELQAGRELIARTLFDEETAFLKTLGKGLKMMEKTILDLKHEHKNVFLGKPAFEMYDTFGFPEDLIQLILKENDIHLDLEGFKIEMEIQKERSRENASIQATDWIIIREYNETQFTGYEKTEDEVLITKYRSVVVKGKQIWQLVFDKTPFYAESGGQAGDTGLIKSGNEEIDITNTIKENNLIIHISDKLPAKPSAIFKANVDSEKRLLTANNHTATHLLHFALRSVLGPQVQQKGSEVNYERLRFDFNHFTKLTNVEISEIEEIVNKMIRKNYKSEIKYGVPLTKAQKMGAVALFGEKYGNTVRVVKFGESVELCGGTHVKNTGSIRIFKIISENSIGTGTRRIEAITSIKAEDYIKEKLKTIEDISTLFKPNENLKESIKKLFEENSSLKKRIEKLQTQETINSVKKLMVNTKNLDNIKFISGQINSESNEVLKNAIYQVRTTLDSSIMVIGSENSGKANIFVAVTDDLVNLKNISAVKIINEIVSEINGKGGGQPSLAVAGGTKPGGILNALNKAKEFLEKG